MTYRAEASELKQEAHPSAWQHSIGGALRARAATFEYAHQEVLTGTRGTADPSELLPVFHELLTSQTPILLRDGRVLKDGHYTDPITKPDNIVRF